jgi:hypothetical protein
MRVLVVTSCTGEKAVSSDNQLTMDDFQKGAGHVIAREKDLAQHLRPAEELYTGQQHVRLMRGVSAFRLAYPTNQHGPALDLQILSAGYGLVPGTRKLAPYEITFQGMRKPILRQWADALGIPESFRNAISQPYDFGLILLGDDYLQACALDQDVLFGGPTLLFCGKITFKKIPKLSNLRPVALSNAEAKRFSCGLVALKGELASRILTRMAADPALTETLFSADDVLNVITEPSDGVPVERKSAQANAAVDYVISLPASWRNKSHREKLRYFIPEWDDLVDPDYDFINDQHSGGQGDWSNQVYAHQMYTEPNYDGILMSRAVAEKSKKKKELINRLGVHRYLRVPPEFPIMGDCGAFDYIMEEVPPYTTEDVIDYYTRLGFNYGVSVDHLIVSATESQKKFRYELTISNAEEFLKEHRKAGLPWEPIGAVQGWDPKSYAEAARQYAKMGYSYIALGGMVRTKTSQILEVIHLVREIIPSDVRIHLLGVARVDALQNLYKAGVQSMDSASYLRQAWMRIHQSYASFDGPYAALRIPEAGKSFRAKQMRSHPELTEKKIVQLERDALDSVRAYAVNNCGLDDCLTALMKYDQFVTTQRIDMREAYRRTLKDRPWEKCRCEICQRWGIEVVIFRGNNRNRRRGFHNTYVFYRMFQDVISGKQIPMLSKKQMQMVLPLEEQ